MATPTDFVSTLFDNQEKPDKVTVALTMAVTALEKDHSASIILMADAVQLARPNAFDSIDIGEPFSPAKELLENFINKGGHILVCGACLQHNGISEDAIDKRFTKIGGDEVVDVLMGAKGSLQLT